MLDAIGTEILARKEEIGRMLSREEGKTLPEGIGETNRAGQIFKFFAGEALRPGGEKIPSIRPNVDVEIIRAIIRIDFLPERIGVKSGSVCKCICSGQVLPGPCPTEAHWHSFLRTITQPDDCLL